MTSSSKEMVYKYTVRAQPEFEIGNSVSKLISRNLKTYQKNKNTLYSTSCSDYEQTIQSFENKSLENELAGLCSTLNV